MLTAARSAPIGSSSAARAGATSSELSDQRPWLGVYAKPLDSTESSSPVRVVGVVPGSPAAALIRPGDILVAVRNAPKLHDPSGNLLGPILYDQISALDSGQTVQLLVRRNGLQIELSIKLGSLAGGRPRTPCRRAALG